MDLVRTSRTGRLRKGSRFKNRKGHPSHFRFIYIFQMMFKSQNQKPNIFRKKCFDAASAPHHSAAQTVQSCLLWQPVIQKIDQVRLGLEPFRNIHSPACSISMCGRQPPRTQRPGKNAQPYHQKWSNGQGFCIQSSCFGADKNGCATNKVQNSQKFCGICILEDAGVVPSRCVHLRHHVNS